MFDNVVVGASVSGADAGAVRRAAALASASGGTVHIVTAFRRGPVDAQLAELRALVSESPVRVRTHPVRSDPVEAIARVAAQEQADLIVLGSKAAGRSRRLSTVSQGVMDRVECAVLVV
jgi:nucleotide-binding universal stress UspA family protein